MSKTSGVEPLAVDSPNAIPKGGHWVDMTETDTIMVIEQPGGQSCAAIGGIMAQKMKSNGVTACVVDGRVRDIAELKASNLPVSRSYSLFVPLLVFRSVPSCTITQLLLHRERVQLPR